MSIPRYAPDNIEELCALLSGNTNGLRIIGGGTDMTIALREKHQRPQGLIWLGNIEQAKGIEMTSDGLVIGAMTTMTELSESNKLSGAYKALAEAAAGVGSEQIRSTATLGGNIANAAPAADTLPPLMLLGAYVQVVGSEGVYWCELESILTGGKKLPNDKAIIAVRLPKCKEGYQSVFGKLGSRRQVTISKLSLALGVVLDGDVIKEVKAFAGAIGLVPLEVEEVSPALKGRKLNGETAEVFGRVLSELVKKAIAGRASLEYKAWSAKAVAADTLLKIK